MEDIVGGWNDGEGVLEEGVWWGGVVRVCKSVYDGLSWNEPKWVEVCIYHPQRVVNFPTPSS